MCICTHHFLFPVTDTSIVFKQFMISSKCLETREDAESPGEADLSEGGEGEVDVDMGERKKRDCVTFKLAFIYMHIMKSLGTGTGPYLHIAVQHASCQVGEAGPGQQDKIPHKPHTQFSLRT
jgi:hypothetical protein